MRLRIEPSSGVPITRQIIDQIRTQCAGGNLAGGDKLPSVRELARELAVNQNTILRVYERLTAEGLLERRHGAGTYVSDSLPGNQLRGQRVALREEIRRVAERAMVLGLEPAELHEMLDRALASLVPDKQPAPEKQPVLEKRS
jgi:GntR family transcriptional regulator